MLPRKTLKSTAVGALNDSGSLLLLLPLNCQKELLANHERAGAEEQKRGETNKPLTGAVFPEEDEEAARDHERERAEQQEAQPEP